MKKIVLIILSCLLFALPSFAQKKDDKRRKLEPLPRVGPVAPEPSKEKIKHDIKVLNIYKAELEEYLKYAPATTDPYFEWKIRKYEKIRYMYDRVNDRIKYLESKQ